MFSISAASGNVFAYLWADEAPRDFSGPEFARALCPRGRGLGLDGLFLLQPWVEGTPWEMDHWEPDGSRTFCSNGTRAAASLLPAGLRGDFDARVSGEAVRLRLDADSVGLRLSEGPEHVLRSALLPLALPHAFGWTGTPHLVVEVPDVDRVNLADFAPPLRHHPDLPEGANVSILQVTALGHARIRSWERGVEGETLCCGQGCAVAGAWLAQRTGTMAWQFRPAGEDPVQVSLEAMTEGRWSGLWLAGPVRRIGTFQPDPVLLNRR